MPRTIISDASCFILLSKIDELDLLQKIYGSITTTSEVASEFGLPLPAWVVIENPKFLDKQLVLEQKLDRGEASAISLALEIADATIILDDQKARKIALELGLDVTGTIGVIIKAKLKGVIPSIQPIIGQIRNTNFRLAPEIEFEALKQAGEL